MHTHQGQQAAVASGGIYLLCRGPPGHPSREGHSNTNPNTNPSLTHLEQGSVPGNDVADAIAAGKVLCVEAAIDICHQLRQG